MSDVELFERLWQDAYSREQEVIGEAQRLAGGDSSLLNDQVSLFALARSLVEARKKFEQGLNQVDPVMTRARRVRAMGRLLEATP